MMEDRFQENLNILQGIVAPTDLVQDPLRKEGDPDLGAVIAILAEV